MFILMWIGCIIFIGLFDIYEREILLLIRFVVGIFLYPSHALKIKFLMEKNLGNKFICFKNLIKYGNILKKFNSLKMF